MKKQLFTLLFILISSSAFAQNYADKTLTREDYDVIVTTARSMAEDYINFVSLIGVPGSTSSEREDYIQKALVYMEGKSTVVYNDLDPTGSTTSEFKVDEYLRNIQSFYPEGVTIYPEEIIVSQVFYDNQSNRYFVKAEVERVLSGAYRGTQEVDDQHKRLDFYIKFYQGSEKSQTRIYSIDKHRENLGDFLPVKIVEGDLATSLFTDEEKETLRTEKDQAVAENGKLKDALSNMQDRLDEEYRKRLAAERKAKKAMKDAEIAKDEATKIKDQNSKVNEKVKDGIRSEKEIFDNAIALVNDYDFLMEKKTVRNTLHRAGHDNLKRFDKESIKYFNQIPTFKFITTQASWDQNSANLLLGRLNSIYKETQETMRSGHKVSLSKRYQHYQEHNRKLFLKGGYGFAGYSDNVEGILDRNITLITAQLALRVAKAGNKRGTLVGFYGMQGTLIDTVFASSLETPASTWNLTTNEELTFTEVEFGCSIKEFWRISAGMGFMDVPTTTAGVFESINYFPVTTGFSISFFRFLEIDLFGTVLLGNENIPMSTFRLGATGNIILKI